MDLSPPPAASTEPAPNDPHQGRAERCACCRDAAAARTERNLALLQELVDIGMDVARMVQQQAAAQAAGERIEAPLWSEGGVSLALLRIHRAVRQTVALQAKLDGDREARDEARAAKRAVAAAQERGRQKKLAVKGIVERAIESDALSQFGAEKMRIDLYERLADADDTRFGDRPISVIIARICRDLHLPFDPSLWQGLDEAGEKVEAKPPDDSPGSGRVAAPAMSRRPKPPARRAATGSDPPPIAVPS
jgi:hypothetical protein